MPNPSRAIRTGAEEPQGPLQVPGANRTKTIRSASLSARARQLTPQAIEREGTWHVAERPALVGRKAVHSGRSDAPGELRRRRLRRDRRRARPRAARRPPRPAPPALRRRRPSAGDAEPRLGPDLAPQVLLLRLPLPAPQLRDRQQPAAERPPHRRGRRDRRRSCGASTATTSPRTRRTASAGTGPPPTGGRRRNGTYTFRIGAQTGGAGGPRERLPRPNLGLELRLLRLRLPAPRRPRLRRRRRSLRRRPRRATPTRART